MSEKSPLRTDRPRYDLLEALQFAALAIVVPFIILAGPALHWIMKAWSRSDK